MDLDLGLPIVHIVVDGDNPWKVHLLLCVFVLSVKVVMNGM